MKQFIEKYQQQIQGVVSGFDRLVFRGSLRRLNYGYQDKARGVLVATGMEQYCWQNKILFMDCRDRVKRVSERLKKQSLKPFLELKLLLIFLRDPQAHKAVLARQLARKNGIDRG